MKVMLINPAVREWAAPNCFPSGLGYIAAQLLKAGHEVDVLDLNALRLPFEDAVKRIAQSDAEIFGAGGLITVYGKIKQLAEFVKEAHPDRPFILGGSVATSVPRLALEKTRADVAVISEGELTVVDLVDAIGTHRDLSTVKGIWYKDGTGIHVNEPQSLVRDLNRLPFPAWDLFPMDVYLRNPIGALNVDKWVDGGHGKEFPPTINMIPTRGCPFQCIYCYHDFMGAGFRFRAPENIVAEIKTLRRRWQVEYVHFCDDCFVIDVGNVKKFCELMTAGNLGVKWGCQGRVNIVTRDMLELMKKAGCISVNFGIESGSPKMLRIMKKRVEVEQAKNAVRLVKEIFGQDDCSFIVGLPGETDETLDETFEFCKSVNIAPEVIFFATPYPGTELFEIASRKGMIGDLEQFVLGLGEQGERITANFTEWSDDELRRKKNDLVARLKAQNILYHETAKGGGKN